MRTDFLSELVSFDHEDPVKRDGQFSEGAHGAKAVQSREEHVNLIPFGQVGRSNRVTAAWYPTEKYLEMKKKLVDWENSV